MTDWKLMYKNNTIETIKATYFWLLQWNFPGWIWKGKSECKNQKQSTILNLRMQLENICLCKDLKSQNKTEFVFISGPIVTSLLIKQDLCNLPNLQEYLKIKKKATGKVFKDSKSFLELRYLAQWKRNSWENLFKDQNIFSSVIISSLLITFSHDNVLILLGENWGWSPSGIEGLSGQRPASGKGQVDA